MGAHTAAVALYRWSIDGGLPSGEVFAFGSHYTASSLGDAQDVADAIAASWDQMWTHSTGGYTAKECFTSTTAFSQVTVFETPAAGGPSTDKAIKTLTQNTGSQGGNPLPPQCAVVVTLHTANATRHGKGRMYLPAPATAWVTAAGRLDTSHRNALAGWAAAFIGDVNSFVGGQSVDVFSRATETAYPVTSISVGDVIDTQRRRRDALVEARQSVDVSAA